MASDTLQPLDSLAPMPKGPEDDNNPAKNDYREGRKFLQDGDYTRAAMAFHNALRGFEEQGNQIGVANSADRLGDACLARDEFAMAIANYQQAYTICEKECDSFSLLSLEKKMAAAYRKLGDADKALELLYNILEHYRQTNNPKGAVEVLALIGETYKEQGNATAAADAYRSVSSIHQRFGHKRQADEFARLAGSLAQEG